MLLKENSHLWRFNVNIMEQYIDEIYSVEDVTKEMEEHGIAVGDERWLRVCMRVDCYSIKSDIKQIFRASEWEEAKKKGYFMG